MRKKTAGSVLIVVLCLALLVGCGSSDAKEGAAAAGQTEYVSKSESASSAEKPSAGDPSGSTNAASAGDPSGSTNAASAGDPSGSTNAASAGDPSGSTNAASAGDPSGSTNTASAANPSGSTGDPSQSGTASPAPSPTVTNKPPYTPKPSPTGTPEPGRTAAKGEPDINLIRSRTEELVASYAGEWSVYFRRMDTGESFCINDTSRVSASLIKLFVYAAAREQIEQGILEEDAYDGFLWDMIVYSDNDSCNILIDAVGGFEPVNEYIRRNGYKASELNRKMMDWNGLENYTSVSDCGHLIEEALKGTLVSQKTSQTLQNAMISGTNTHKIRAGIPEGVVAGNKTGELDYVDNDAAFIFSPACTYVLCVMTSGLDAGTAYDNIAELSAAVYSLLNQ